MACSTQWQKQGEHDEAAERGPRHAHREVAGGGRAGEVHAGALVRLLVMVLVVLPQVLAPLVAFAMLRLAPQLVLVLGVALAQVLILVVVVVVLVVMILVMVSPPLARRSCRQR